MSQIWSVGPFYLACGAKGLWQGALPTWGLGTTAVGLVTAAGGVVTAELLGLEVAYVWRLNSIRVAPYSKTSPTIALYSTGYFTIKLLIFL